MFNFMFICGLLKEPLFVSAGTTKTFFVIKFVLQQKYIFETSSEPSFGPCMWLNQHYAKQLKS